MSSEAFTVTLPRTRAEARAAAERLAARLIDELPILAGPLACVILLALLRFNPFALYWELVFRDLRGYLWWPLPFVIAALLFVLGGWWHHRRHGAPMFRPSVSRVGTWVIVTALVLPITAWSADRSLLWCLAVTALCGVAAASLATGGLCYDESWRLSLTAPVIESVRGAIRGGRFRAHLAGQDVVPPPRFGSPHCLLIVDANYRETKLGLLDALAAGRSVSREDLDTCVDAAQALIEYLGLPWAPYLSVAADWRSRRAEVVREIATMWAWAARVDPAHIGRDAGVIHGLLDQAARDLGPAYQDYVQCLRLVFDVGTSGPVDAAVRDILPAYGRIGDRMLTVRERQVSLRAIVRDTWLTVATGAIDDQVAIDVWLVLHRDHEPLSPGRVDADDPDPAGVGARVAQAELYQRWTDRIPPPWNDAIAVRAAQTADALRVATSSADAIWPTVLQEAQQTSSWSYWWVWCTPAVQRQAALRLAIVAVPCLVALAAAAPAMIGNLGWNTIDAVDEHNVFADYREGETRAMAGTDRSLVVASSAGLLAVDLRSRVISRRDDAGVLDLTTGPRIDDRTHFVLLHDDQSVALLDAERLATVGQWMAPPAQPVWRGGADSGRILANVLDGNGWLVVMEGRGVARYRLGPRAVEGVRLRSWDLTGLSGVPVTDAIATAGGVWLRTTKGVSFAEGQTLQPVHAKGLAQLLNPFDAGPLGTWALGVDGNGAAFLWSQALGRWSEGFFTRHNTRLASEADVTVAAMTGGVAWLGARHGLSAYDIGRRALSTILPNVEVRGLEVIDGGVLAATSGGLHRVGADGSTMLDEGAVSGLATSPDRTAAVWRRQVDNTPVPEVRYRRLDDPKAPAITLSNALGWQAVAGGEPVLLAARPVSLASTMFVTTTGAFSYNHERPAYQDVSSSIVSAERVVPLRTIASVDIRGDRLVALADGGPHTIKLGEPRWRALDPSGATRPLQLAATADRVFGIGAQSELHVYAPARRDLNTAGSKAFAATPPAGNDFTGDVLPAADGGFRMALLHQGAVTIYDHHLGTFVDEARRFVSDEAIQQIRLQPDGSPVYVARGGTLLDRDHRAQFGSGSLPFTLDEVTALAPGRTPGTVIVGGSGGFVGEYAEATGSWTPIGGRLGAGAVTALDVDATGILARHGPGVFSFAIGNTWFPLSAYDAVARVQGHLFASDSGGIVTLSPSAGSHPNLWGTRRFSSTAGLGLRMRAFLARAVYAWAPTPTRVLFVGADGLLGEYDLATDSSREGTRLTCGEPAQVRRAADTLVVVCRSGQVVRIGPDLGVTTWGVVPLDATTLAIHADAEWLRLTFVRGGQLHVREWSLTGDRSVQRAAQQGGRAAIAFNPSEAIHVEPQGALLRFVDGMGAIADYAPALGVWRGVRVGDLDARAVGWMKAGDQQPPMLVLERAGGGALFLSVRDGSTAQAPAMPAEMAPLRSGVLHEAEGIRVVRETGRTVVSARGRALTAQAGGFAEDVFLDAAIDADGRVMALRAGMLVHYAITPAGLLAPGPEWNVPSSATSIKTLPRVLPGSPIRWPAAVEPGVLARLPFAGRELQFSRGAAEGIDVTWRAAAGDGVLPVWGACGRLAFQCVRELAAGSDGTLLVATELGVLHRDPVSYELRALSPHARIAAPSGTTTIEVAAWRWSLDASGGPLNVQGRDGAPRGLTPVGPREWRFRDDVVRWIHRRADGLCVSTMAGSWRVEAGFQRGTAACQADGVDRLAFDHPALKIAYQQGRVTLMPFDGVDKPAIVRGRLFFETGTQIAASDDRLYTLVPARGIFERDPANPAVVRQAWTVPVASPGTLLDATPDGPRVIVRGPSPADGSAEAYDTDRTRRSWTRRALGSVVTAVTPVVEWRGDGGRHAPVAPYVQGGTPRRLSIWWSGDRFAWDRVHGVGALSRDTIVFATAAGPIVRRLTDGNRLAWLHWIPDRPVVRAGTARQGGRPIGVAVTAADGRELLVVAAASGTPKIVEHAGGRSLYERAVLTVGFVDVPPLGRHVTIVESWEVGSDPALRNGLRDVLPRLFREGQFAFDGAAAGVPLADGTWWLSPRCQGSGCVVTQNTIDDGRLVLRGISSAPCGFQAMRTPAAETSAPTVLGACQGKQPDVWQWANGAWATIARDGVRPAFARGHRVNLNVRGLTWSIAGSQDLWAPAAFTVDEPGFPLFADVEGGIALSFDVFTSVAWQSSANRLAIGTRGGLWNWQIAGSGAGLRLTSPSLIFPATSSSQPSAWAVVKSRTDATGDLWTRLRSNIVVKVGKAGTVTTAATWPPGVTDIAGYRVHLDGIGITTPSRQRIDISRDAWHLGRHPLADIVDFHRDNDALWVATRREGLVKVFTR